jgi:hypothetical protein
MKWVPVGHSAGPKRAYPRWTPPALLRAGAVIEDWPKNFKVIRRVTMLAYLTLVATAFAGVFGLSWWAVPAGACVLALISQFEQRREFAGGPRLSHAALYFNLVGLISLGTGLCASTAAYALGHFTVIAFRL